VLAANDYVAFRRHHIDEATVKEVQKEMQDNNIDASQMLELRADHCQQVEFSKEGWSSA
jgi:hypothetical protein